MRYSYMAVMTSLLCSLDPDGNFHGEDKKSSPKIYPVSDKIKKQFYKKEKK